MNIYKCHIKPSSPFATLPYADTIFGQLIWMLRFQKKDVGYLLESYLDEPFLVVSDFLINNKGYIPRLPQPIKKSSKEEQLQKMLYMKHKKNYNVIDIDYLLNQNSIKIGELLENSEKQDNVKSYEMVHCTINRMTGTTGENVFSPYTVKEYTFAEGVNFTFYFGIKDSSIYQDIVDALDFMGRYGFGKDASTGKGQFRVETVDKINIHRQNNANALYTLGPTVLEGIKAQRIFYEPFTRFGRHGALYATSGTPFKNPVVMAKQGALIIAPESNLFSKKFVGKGLDKLSAHSETVHQGYSLAIPLCIDTSEVIL